MKQHFDAIGAAFGRSDFLDKQRANTDRGIANALSAIAAALHVPGRKSICQLGVANKRAVELANLLGYDGLFHTDAEGSYLLYEPYMEFEDEAD